MQVESWTVIFTNHIYVCTRVRIRSTVKKAFPFFNGFYTAMFGNSEADEAPPDSTVRYCTTRYHNEIAHGENTVIENNIDNADEEK